MTDLSFRLVDQHVARNPIARAVAKARITQAVRDFQTRLYLLADGEDVAADVYASAKVIAVALATAEERRETESPDYRVMKGAMGALVAITGRGNTWRQSDATAVDVGLQRALEVYGRASALEVQRAHQRIERMERTQ